MAYVKSLTSATQKNICISVILVDNTERDIAADFPTKLEKFGPGVEYIKTPCNLGYFGGAQFGLEAYLKTKELPDWVVVSNVDLLIEDEKIFERLHITPFSDRVGVIAPSIWSDHWQMDRNPKMMERPARKTIQRYKTIYRNYLILNIYQLLGRGKSWLRHRMGDTLPAFLFSLLMPNEGKSNPKYTGDMSFIYAPHGSCVFISKRFFERGGSINYPGFLFMEEIFIAETARQLDLDVVYVPSLKLIHHDHVSTGIWRSPVMANYMYKSAVYIADTFFPKVKI